MTLLRYRSLRLCGLSLIMLLVVLSSGGGCGSTQTQPHHPDFDPPKLRQLLCGVAPPQRRGGPCASPINNILNLTGHNRRSALACSLR